MLGFIKNKFKKVYNQFTSKASSIFQGNKLDDEFIQQLYALLISADTGVKTKNEILEKLKNNIKSKKVSSLLDAKKNLEDLLVNQLKQQKKQSIEPKIILLVGVNGSGKTTFAGKLANKFKQKGKTVLLVAGDTFRAAATEQLNLWAKQSNTEIFIGQPNQDSSSVIFDACKLFREKKFDHMIIDTAGRLQTKINLMKELEKIKKIINKILPKEKINTWITIDSMLGQNSFNQAELFHQSTHLNGLILSKLDGTGKGGIVFSITEKLQLPILYIAHGEGINDISEFNPEEYVIGLFEK